MKISRLLLVFFLLYTVNGIAFAGSISGKIIDKEGKALAYTNVVLLTAESNTLVKAEYTNEDGSFVFNGISKGVYVLKCVLLGYDTYHSEKIISDNNAIVVPDIHLTTGSNKLNEVAVSALKPFIEVHADKLIVNVENSIVSAGQSALDVLSRSPGVTVDQNDNISLKGKQGVNVMINGKIQPMTAADLANMLKSMPSEMIDRVEIISNPSAKYDAAGAGGIINIILKKDKKMGVNGNVFLGYGQGIYPKKNAGFSLNYRNKNLNVYANYNLSDREGLNKVSFDRKFYDNNILSGEFNQHNYTSMLFTTNNAAAGLDYYISKKTTIGMALNGETFYLGTRGNYLAQVLDNTGAEQSYFATINGSTGQWNNYGANANLKHILDSTGGELTIDADYARYWNKNYQDFTTRYYLPDGSVMQDPYLLHADIVGLTQIHSVKADLTKTVKGGIHLEAGIKASLVSADNMPSFYNRSSGGNTYDASKSDHFIYSEDINAAYLNISRDWKKVSAQFGLRGEQTIDKGEEKITGQAFNRNYTNLFPSFAVQEHVNANNELGLTLSRRIERPDYDALNPYKFFVDPSTYKEGNPYLLPALSYSAELSHTFKQRIITTLNYTLTDNVITEVIQPSLTQDRVTIQTQVNIAHMAYYGISGAYTLSFYKWWNNVSSINVYYAQYQGDLVNTNLDKGKMTFDINTTNRFMLPHDWTTEITFFYQAPQLYGYLNLNERWSLNIGAQKNMWGKKATVRLNVSDIFWKNNPAGSSVYAQYYEFFYAYHDTRQANLSFTYRFGKNTVAPVRRHSSGAEDEIRRAGGGKA